MPKKKMKWVVIKIFNRIIWIEKDDIKGIELVGNTMLQNGTRTKLYKVLLSDGKIIPQCELRNEKDYDDFNKKDLTKETK